MGIFLRFSNSVVHNLRRTFSTEAAVNVDKMQLKCCKTQRFNAIIESTSMLNEKLKRNETCNNNNWIEIRKELITNFDLTDVNVDSQIYEICVHYENYKEAKNYFKFLEKNNYTLNLNVIGNYLKTFYLQNEKITDEEENEIFRIYDNLRKQYKLFDSKTSNDCILALSLTKRWKETLELLEMLKLLEIHPSKSVNAIIAAAFNNNEPEIGWKMFKEIVPSVFIENSVYFAYLEYCIRHFKGDDLKTKIEEMFYFWKENNVIITEPVVLKYAFTFKLFGYSHYFTGVTNQGECHNCKHRMEPFSLTKKDFQTLSQSIFKKVIIGENVHISTSPEELKRYMIFIKTMKPYDVVIDGLNVAYAAGKNSNKIGTGGCLQNILDVINHFAPSKKRVLVIGRAHMNWWSKSIMNSIRQKADVFLMKNISKDDQFLLHVTLMSGAQTYFVSRDLMRQHKNKIEDINIQVLFKRWQMSRQYKYHKLNPQKPIQLIPPCPFDHNVQKYENGWHIPFTTNTSVLPDEYEPPERWICLRKSGK